MASESDSIAVVVFGSIIVVIAISFVNRVVFVAVVVFIRKVCTKRFYNIHIARCCFC